MSTSGITSIFAEIAHSPSSDDVLSPGPNLLSGEVEIDPLARAQQQDHATLSEEALHASSAAASASSSSASHVVTAGDIQAEIVNLVDSVVRAMEAGDAAFVRAASGGSGAMGKLMRSAESSGSRSHLSEVV
ncbi:MAG: hypothetical protein ACLQG3_11520 [Terracidiphilus sp.]